MNSHWLDQAVMGTVDSANLLSTAASAGVQQRVLYKVAQQTHALPANTPIKNPVPAEAVAYLRLLLNGIHELALLDWLTTIYEMGYQMPFEVIVLFIDFLAKKGINNVFWYPLIKRAFGVNGRLRATVVLGDMALNERQKDFISDKLSAAYEKTAEPPPLMLDITRRLTENPTAFLNLSPLLEVNQLWTAALTQAFIEYVASSGGTYDQYGLQYFLYHMDLDFADMALERWTITDYLEHSPHFIKVYPQNMQMIRVVLDFRQRMVETIRQGGTV